MPDSSVAAKYHKRCEALEQGWSWNEYVMHCGDAHRYPLGETVRVAGDREIERGDMQIADVVFRIHTGWPRWRFPETLDDERLIGEGNWLFYKAAMGLWNAPDGTRVRDVLDDEGNWTGEFEPNAEMRARSERLLFGEVPTQGGFLELPAAMVMGLPHDPEPVSRDDEPAPAPRDDDLDDDIPF
jgi:hypothetical protein